MSNEWGVCPCGGRYDHRLVKIDVAVMTDVPQGVCNLCGSRVYKAEALARIEQAMLDEQIDRRLGRAREL